MAIFIHYSNNFAFAVDDISVVSYIIYEGKSELRKALYHLAWHIMSKRPPAVERFPSSYVEMLSHEPHSVDRYPWIMICHARAMSYITVAFPKSFDARVCRRADERRLENYQMQHENDPERSQP